MGEFISKYGNPWAFETWNVTNQGLFLQQYGERRAQAFAAQVGSVNGARPPDPRRTVVRDVYIISRKIGGDGGGGTGTSGTGPPT